MSAARTLSASALTALYLGSGLVQAAALFGILVSVIAWTALFNGAPGFFAVGPAICGALMLRPIAQRHSSVDVLKRGQAVLGHWASIERQRLQVNRPRGGGDWLVRATWTYQGPGGKQYQGTERMREPNAPERGDSVSLLMLLSDGGRVIRPGALHASLEIGDTAVTTTKDTWSLLVLPVLFLVINLGGVLALIL